MNTAIRKIAEKLAGLPPYRVSEVTDFVDFLSEREHDRSPRASIQTASEPALARLWNNDADAIYDRL
jgi:hypothetical protein